MLSSGNRKLKSPNVSRIIIGMVTISVLLHQFAPYSEGEILKSNHVCKTGENLLHSRCSGLVSEQRR